MSERESIRVLDEAAATQRRKSEDYQHPNSTVVQADYYPNGISTIQDILHAKMLRARSLLESRGTPNYESLEDTYKDMINYCSFAVAWLRGKVPGQDPTRDMFNRPAYAPAEVERVAEPAQLAPTQRYSPLDCLRMGIPYPQTASVKATTGTVSYNAADQGSLDVDAFNGH